MSDGISAKSMATPAPDADVAASRPGEARLGDWANLSLRLVWCYRGPVYSAYRRGSGPSIDHAVWWIHEGGVTIKGGGHSLQAGRDEWVVPPSGIVDREFSDDAVITSVRFLANWPDRSNLFENTKPLVFPVPRYPALRAATGALLLSTEKYIQRPNPQLHEAAIPLADYARMQGSFLEWLGQLVEALGAEGLTHTRFGHIDERVRQGLFFLDHLPIAAKLPQDTLARRLGLGRSQTDRLFMQELGLTPKAYFEKRRFQRARQMLADAEVPVKEVCFRLGFQSASHFSTWFRRLEGKAPRDFAESARRSSPW